MWVYATATEGEALVKLLCRFAPVVETLRLRHVSENGELLPTVLLGDLARYTFEQGDSELIAAVNELLVVGNIAVRNLLLTGFVEGVPEDTPDEVVDSLPEPLRTHVDFDLGRDPRA